MNNWICGVLEAAIPVLDGRLFSLPVHPEKVVLMEVKLYVGNLPRATTGKELNALFAQAGEVTSVDLITDRRTGGSQGYAYVTMSTQTEADKAVSMFNAYFLNHRKLKVALTKPRQQRGFVRMY
jgi:RNA recognition motif-containing protein